MHAHNKESKQNSSSAHVQITQEDLEMKVQQDTRDVNVLKKILLLNKLLSFAIRVFLSVLEDKKYFFCVISLVESFL